MDTWRLARYMESEREHRLVSSYFRAAGSRHPEVGDYRLDWSPGHGLLSMEGHPSSRGLGDPAGLGDAEAAALEALRDTGLPTGREGGVGRLDLTATLDFGDPRRGSVFLSGLAVVDVPRRKTVIWRGESMGAPVETVEFRGPSGRSILSRAYDKGTERAAARDFSASAPAGTHVRLEAQNRFAKDARMGAVTIAQHSDLAANLFTARFAPVAASCEGLTAATAEVLVDELKQRVRAETVTRAAAGRMLSYLLLGDTGLSEATRRRHRRELREHGLILADPFADPVSVNLADGVEAAVEAWSRA